MIKILNRNIIQQIYNTTNTTAITQIQSIPKLQIINSSICRSTALKLEEGNVVDSTRIQTGHMTTKINYCELVLTQDKLTNQNDCKQ